MRSILRVIVPQFMLLIFVLLLLNNIQDYGVVIVYGYPNEAGSCHANQAAVQGSHISHSTTTRIVRSGSIDDTQSNRQVYVNGRIIPTTKTIELQYGIEYLIEIVATSGQTSFKGVLLRMESLAFTQKERDMGVSQYTLLPLINAQNAEVCSNGDSTSTIQGVTHYDNSPKFVFSSSIVIDPPTYNITKSSYYAMDVTIVDYNNSTGSVYWYSQYSFEGVAKLSKNEPIKIPEVVVTEQPSPTPTTSPYPTYQDKCYVCGSSTKEVMNADSKVILFSESASCKEIDHEGRHGLLPPQHCTIIQAAVADACGCQDIVTTKAPVITPTNDKNINDIPTISPTITIKPTNSALPTYGEKCHVCNNDPNQIVTNGLQLIQLNGITGTCLQLFDDGRDGYLYPDLCPEAQTIAKTYCNCTSTTTISSPSGGDVSIIDSPTTSPAPSISPYPTYDAKCYVCHDDINQVVTAPNQLIHVNGRTGTCADLQQQGLEGYIHPSLCSDAQQVASTICECKTVNHIPPTQLPTYHEKCHVCGGDENRVVTHNATLVLLQDEILNCEELYEAGIWGLMPPQYCEEGKRMALEFCGCTSPTAISTPVVAPPTIIQTLSPTITAEPTITNRPTFQEKCNICNSSENDNNDSTTNSNQQKQQSSNSADSTRTVRNTDSSSGSEGDVKIRSGVIEYDGILWDCNILLDLGESGNISPTLCPIFQEKAQLNCPCNEHKTRHDPPLPKTLSFNSHAATGSMVYTLTQYAYLLGLCITTIVLLL